MDKIRQTTERDFTLGNERFAAQIYAILGKRRYWVNLDAHGTLQNQNPLIYFYYITENRALLPIQQLILMLSTLRLNRGQASLSLLDTLSYNKEAITSIVLV
ncbi:MAG TPA: hypothetical protein DEO56_05340 [Nitrosomonas nitrosa]|uniref:Uncharacterized protein n=1 Tax=Nitrosomonas nitrosa TaxID=52442 RepID=A0A1I4N4D9_9PROT|nr:hypothetical protein SAMN05421880_10686 [Nitrosomonas nitrosa]HBZ30005.1 hypothetical protein [Nitrosomonas nitrosa]